MSPSSTQEQDTLLACLNHWSRAVTILQSLTPREWLDLLHLADRLAVAPLVYASICKRVEAVQIPYGLLQNLEILYQANTLRNMELYRALYMLLGKLRVQGIPVIVLKGAYLAQHVYQDIALRTMADLDILVPALHIDQVQTILARLGYQLDERKDLSGNSYHLAYRSSENPILAVEVHWDLEPAHSPFRVDVEDLWQRARPVNVAGVDVLALSPEDLLLHLCLHTAHRHLFGHYSLRALCDIRAVLRHSGHRLDWDLLCLRSRQWGCDHSLYLTLLLARDLFEVDAPIVVFQRLRPHSFDPRLRDWARQRLFALVDDKVGPWSDHLGQVIAAPGLEEKLRLLFHLYILPHSSTYSSSGSGEAKSGKVHFWQRAQTLLKLMMGNPEMKLWLEREAGRVSLSRWLSTSSSD